MAKTKTAPKIALTEFTPEEHAKVPTRDEVLKAEQDKKIKGFIASIDRELQRISVENGVRIGDTALHESHACDLFKATLLELREVYVQSI
jgi:hypothetical protein